MEIKQIPTLFAHKGMWVPLPRRGLKMGVCMMTSIRMAHPGRIQKEQWALP